MTMGELIPLFHLTPDRGVSQRELAELWSCDPSWVTNRIDRLEALGLAERRVSPTDRRVKQVWLTAVGVERRSLGMVRFAEPPAELLALAPEDLEALVRILARVAPEPAVGAVAD